MNGPWHLPAWLEGALRLITALVILYMLAYAGGALLVAASGFLGDQGVQFDFVALWAAAKLALAGDTAAAFDQPVLREAQALPADARPGELYWLYPPGLLIVLAPLGLLPFWGAWALFVASSMALYLGALWRLAGAVPLGRHLLIAAPIVIHVFHLGQLSLLWAALIVAALEATRRRHYPVAGLAFALLSLKPQFGVLVPFALVAGRHWPVFLWTAIGFLVVHGLPTLVVGLESWGAFFARLAEHLQRLAADEARWDLMVTPYALSRLVGLGHSAALWFQYALTAVLAAATMRLWRPGRDFDLAAGALCLGALLATPYAYYYELTLCIPAALYLGRGGFARHRGDGILLVLLVLGPAVFWIRNADVSPLFALLMALIFFRVVFCSRRAQARPAAAITAASPASAERIAQSSTRS